MLHISRKGFTLLELLIVIGIIAILSTFIMITVSGSRQKAVDAKAKYNRQTARRYCALNPGISEHYGDTVYCDEHAVMWSITLDGTYQWKTEDTALPAYANGDCNNLTVEDMKNYPACNACYNLSYAGFSEGWRLPTQGTGTLASARDGEYCAPGRQLWDMKPAAGNQLNVTQPNPPAYLHMTLMQIQTIIGLLSNMVVFKCFL